MMAHDEPPNGAPPAVWERVASGTATPADEAHLRATDPEAWEALQPIPVETLLPASTQATRRTPGFRTMLMLAAALLLTVAGTWPLLSKGPGDVTYGVLANVAQRGAAESATATLEPGARVFINVPGPGLVTLSRRDAGSSHPLTAHPLPTEGGGTTHVVVVPDDIQTDGIGFVVEVEWIRPDGTVHFEEHVFPWGSHSP